MIKGLFNVIAQILKGEYSSSNLDKKKHIVVINRDSQESLEKEKTSDKEIDEEKTINKYEQEGSVKKGKYTLFEEFLQKEEKEEYILTYKEIEEIIGDVLPKTAYNRPSWMGNNDTYPLPKIWMKYGYESTDVKVGETVTLKKR